MDSKIIAALIGLFGVSLAALLAGVGYYLKTKSERKQTKHIVLYHLLEIKQLIHFSYFNTEEVVNEYIRHCNSILEKYKLNDSDIASNEIKTIIGTHFSNVIAASKPQLDNDFLESYEIALKDLSKTDPLLAFKLRGREQVAQILQFQDQYIAQLKSSSIFDTPSELTPHFERQTNQLNNQAIDSLIDEINSEIIAVAKTM